MKEEEGDLQEAARILQELQVETYGSMERKEKVIHQSTLYFFLWLREWRKPVLWILIGFNVDSDPAFYLHAAPDQTMRIRIQILVRL
jgi:hypothetical protein